MTVSKERIGLISSAVPLVNGGYRNIIEGLEAQLLHRGHQVETIYIPTSDEPETVLDQMLGFRLIELDNHFDRVITFRPPAHMVRHRKKVCWFIHHIRYFYDLWSERPFNPLPDTLPALALRDTVRRADTAALSEAHTLFSNSKVVSARLMKFNGLASATLYPPVPNPEAFFSREFGDEVVCVCRIEEHKRQHLLVAAMAHVRSPVRLRLCGMSSSETYVERLRNLMLETGNVDRIIIENRWITEEEKYHLLAGSLAAAYVAFQEDSYGYPTLEAAHAARPTLVLGDGGGVLEFVTDGLNGRVVEPDAKAIARALDDLYLDKKRTRRMGKAAKARIKELGINWDNVVERLLG